MPKVNNSSGKISSNIKKKEGQNEFNLGLMFIFVCNSAEFNKSVLISKVIYHLNLYNFPVA